MKRDSTEDFIIKSQKVHGDMYDYSQTAYKTNHEKVIIICPEHGPFKQAASSHKRGSGCPTCCKEVSDTKSFIKKAKEVHGDKYDYSLIDYQKNNKKVTIICPEHGEFQQRPNCHTMGAGCSGCSKNRAYTTETFIKKAKEIHGDKYDYSNTKYTSSQSKIEIICKVHGPFLQKAANHLKGNTCKFCAGIYKRTKEQFISNARKVHGNRYDYSLVDYQYCDIKVTILCPIHGEFEQTPSKHLYGGCYLCDPTHKSNTEEFIPKAVSVHGNRYDYSLVDYINNRTPVIIICPEHGKFDQTPDSHLSGRGCRTCAKSGGSSSVETEIHEFLESFYDGTIKLNTRKIIPPFELDIILPEEKIAIELNGAYWHSSAFKVDKDYHLNKTTLAKKKGYNLIHIYEDEWRSHKNQFKTYLRNMIESNDGLIASSLCEVDEISKSDYQSFIADYSINQSYESDVMLGLYHNSTVVACMGFVKLPFDNYELSCYLEKIPTLNGFDKLISHFKKSYDWHQITHYADRRNFNENLFKNSEFAIEKVVEPTFDYTKSNYRYSREEALNRENISFYNPSKEEQIMEDLGYYRVWDCGYYKFSMINT